MKIQNNKKHVALVQETNGSKIYEIKIKEAGKNC